MRNTPSASRAGQRAHLRAPSRRRRPARPAGSASRIAASPSRTTPSGRLVNPAPIPTQRRPGSSPSSDDLRGDVRRLVAVERAAPRRPPPAPARRARTRRRSRGRSPSGGRSTTASDSRARRSAAPSSRVISGSRPAATPNPRGLLDRQPRPLEERDALDVRRVRKHVHRPHLNQLEAGVDDLAGVGGQRRRVAGDVDDPPRLRLEQAADDLLREAGTRRVDDDDVGAAAPPPASGRSAVRASPAKKRALSISFSRAFSIASAIACSAMSTPQTSAECSASTRLQRADAAVDVEDPLASAEARVLGRELVEPLGHLGVGLEEGLRRDPEAQARDLLLRGAPCPARTLVVPPCETSAAALGLRPQQRRRHRSARALPAASSLERKSPSLVTSRTWRSPVRRPSRTTRLRRKPRAVAPVVALRPCCRAPVAHEVANGVAAFGRQHAVAGVLDPLPAGRGRGSRARARRHRASPNEYSILLR